MRYTLLCPSNLKLYTYRYTEFANEELRDSLWGFLSVSQVKPQLEKYLFKLPKLIDGRNFLSRSEHFIDNWATDHSCLSIILRVISNPLYLGFSIVGGYIITCIVRRLHGRNPLPRCDSNVMSYLLSHTPLVSNRFSLFSK